MRRLLIGALSFAVGYSLLIVAHSVANETDADVPLSGISSSLQPDLLTGILTGGLPIEVPPGRNGMQPNLALSYASSSGNGWVGMGWKLEMGTIERQTRWGVLYPPSAQDDLDGKVYTIHLNGVSVDLLPAPPPAPSDEYRAKIEGGFLRIRKVSGGTAGWEVTDPRGVKYLFGTTTTTRMADPNDTSKIFKWCLEKMVDRNGNHLVATYSFDNNQGYLDQIQYGGNDGSGGGPVLAHTHTIKFWRDDGTRPDQGDMYTSNYLIKTRYRLKTIEIKVNGSLIRAYGLTYSPSSFPSFLSSVQQFGKDSVVSQQDGTITGGTPLPAMVAGYKNSFPAASFAPYVATSHATTGDFTEYTRLMADVNGDGRTDAVLQLGINTGWQTRVALSQGDGTFAPYVATSHASTGDYTTWTKTMADVNGDGRMDAVVQLGNATGWYTRVATMQGGNDLLNALTNGLGGATTITYLPSTQYANTQLPYAIQTVSAVTTCDNWNSSTSTCIGMSSDINYSYTGGYHHIAERDFRGFKTAVVTSSGATDADKTVATTWFHQGNELTPVDTENPGLANGYMKGKPYRMEVRRKSDNLLYTKTETTYLADQIGADTTAPWFTPLAQVDSLICDGAPCTTTRVTYAAADYDAYGNVLKESHHGDLTVTGDEKTIERAFVPPNTTDYVVSAPAREAIYKGLSVASTDKLAETIFYYDGTGTGACTAAPTGSNTAVTKGKLTKIERLLSGGTNPISGMEYDSATGVLLCSRDPLGNKTTLTYDPTKTFVLTSTNQLGHVTTTVYSGVNGVAIDPTTGFYGALKNVTDPNGKIVSYEYDALGRKTKTTAPDGLVTTVTYPTPAEYGVIGTQKTTTTTNGASLPANLVTNTFFDGLGRTFKKERSGPNSTTLVAETQYDVKGQVFRTSLPYFKTTESVTNRWRTMAYDPIGRVTQVTHPDVLNGNALFSKSCYAPFITVTLDPSGARKRETKDAYGRVVKIEEYSTTTSICDTSVGTPYATTNYTYDLLGNLTKVVDALGNRTTMRYDSLSRKIGMSDPDMSTNGTSTCGDLTTLAPAGTYPWYATPCWNYQYDAVGNLTRQTDAKNQHLWFRYDGLNRRTQKDYTTQKAAGSGDVRYIYDDTVTTYNRKGRLKQVVDAATNVTFEYDTLGRISKSTRVLDSTTYITTSIYDGLGRLKEVTYPTSPAKTVEYLYTGPVLERVRDKSGSGTTIYAIYSNYTSQGQAQTITYGNGVVTTSTFADPAHTTCIPANTFKLCTLKTQKGTNPLYQDLTYTFTADGDMDLITDPINGNQDFDYDALDRLISAIGPYDTGGATITRTYTYNQIGNILTNSWLTAGTFTYPAGGPGVVRPHAVQAAGPYTYSYDNNGNQTGITSTLGDYSSSTTFNVDNRLASAVTMFGTTTINSTFVYDGDGQRVKKIVGTTTTRYISKLYECDTTGANTSCSRFIWAGDTRIATIAVTSGTVHYWHGDHLGSSSVITDSTGAKVQALTYQPHGGVNTNQSFTTPAVDVPYKFTGKEFDYSTDFYYYESRYYDPWFGRFISPDSIVSRPGDPQDLNRYAYARNNPLLYTDPTGHFFKKFFKGLFKNPFVRALGWVTAPMLMQFVDPFTSNMAIEGTVRAGMTIVAPGCSYCMNTVMSITQAGLALSDGEQVNMLHAFGKGAMTGITKDILGLGAIDNIIGWSCKFCNGAINGALGATYSQLVEGKSTNILRAALAEGTSSTIEAVGSKLAGKMTGLSTRFGNPMDMVGNVSGAVASAAINNENLIKAALGGIGSQGVGGIYGSVSKMMQSDPWLGADLSGADDLQMFQPPSKEGREARGILRDFIVDTSKAIINRSIH